MGRKEGEKGEGEEGKVSQQAKSEAVCAQRPISPPSATKKLLTLSACQRS